jgi:response regulator NasT
MRKIAVVDDNPSERLVLKGFLEEAGLSIVAEGVSGTEALDICRLKSPDLLIMDVKMPGKDGIEAAGEIARLCPTPIVLLTGCDDEETIRRAAEAGVMGYLMKPVRAEEIAPSVELAITMFNEFNALRKENEDLRNTLQARKKIEKAKGLLMEREGLSETDAFTRIRKISMDKRKTMAEVAEVIIMALDKG